jgi:16S rRNA (guanine527-N7)-methyltransferase
MNKNVIENYFPNISQIQKNQFDQLGELYKFWNNKINLISRRDIDNLYVHHILHSLSIAKIVNFVRGTKIIDVGTGGGFPGVPLAILFPDVEFYLVDSINKKIIAIKAISKELNLLNVEIEGLRIESIFSKYDFVLGRGVANIDKFCNWTYKNISNTTKNTITNGILYLCGNTSNK